jgi:inhibitor of KinA sporulation pathway (predicted exonuclease)
MGETYISVDIEASGPVPGEYSILSIGAAVVGELDMKFYAEVKPINGNFVESVLDIGRFSMEKLSETGEEPSAAIERFAKWVEFVSGNDMPVFVSFGTFDWMFIKWYLVKFGRENLFGQNNIDMKSYYMGVLGGTWEETMNKKIPKFIVSNRNHTHNALDDALEQAEIFEKMLKYSKRELTEHPL